MRILIIEDEMPAFKRLSKLIKELLPEAELLGPIDSVADAQQWFKLHVAPDVLFTDIQLADGTTFDFINSVAPNCPIIFTTAFDEYALDAFRTTGIDYLLKPVKREHLSNALSKLRNLQDIFKKELIKPVNLDFKRRFVVKFGDHIKVIDLDNIAYFFSENKSTFIKTTEAKAYPIDNNLDALEQLTDPQLFFRLNRQYLVAIAAIKSVKTHTKGRVMVSLNPSVEEPVVVSSEKSNSFKQWLAGEQ